MCVFFCESEASGRHYAWVLKGKNSSWFMRLMTRFRTISQLFPPSSCQSSTTLGWVHTFIAEGSSFYRSRISPCSALSSVSVFQNKDAVFCSSSFCNRPAFRKKIVSSSGSTADIRICKYNVLYSHMSAVHQSANGRWLRNPPVF